MAIAGFTHQGSKHAETGHVRDLLAHQGVLAPHTGQPLSEELLLGIGGGVDGAYFLCGTDASSGGKFLTVGGRHHPMALRSEFIDGIAQRLGARVTVKEAGTPNAGVANLTAALADGQPAVVWVAQGMIPYHHVAPRLAKMFTYTLLVTDFDEDSDVAQVCDRPATPMTLSAEQLTEARGGICTHKYRVLTFAAPRTEINLREAIRAGLRDCWQGLLEPKMGSLGIAGLEKWASLIANPRNKDGWPKALPPGRLLYEVLSQLYHWVETSGSGGGNFRAMYADFLDEASAVLQEKGLKDVARRYRDLAGKWTDLARAALPDSAKPLKKTRELLTRRNEVFEQKGARGLKELAKLSGQLDEIAAPMGKSFPLRAVEVLALLEDLRDRLVRIIEAEKAAANELKRLAA